MFVPLNHADTATCGGKAASLAALARAGLPVPDGFVVPVACYLDAANDSGTSQRLSISDAVVDALRDALAALGDPHVAVRSSATCEDTAQVSAAGQYESVLAVQGVDEVADAVRACWTSLFSPRANAYRSGPDDDGPDGWRRSGSGDPAMAVLVQRHVAAEVSGVMFTPARAGDATVLEASWGLGPSVVAGGVTPDTYIVESGGRVVSTVGDKRTRLDYSGMRLHSHEVPTESRCELALNAATARELAALGQETAAILGGPQDIEWAVTDGYVWLVQARPITAELPAATPPSGRRASSVLLTGASGSHGTVTGTARVVRGPDDFPRVLPGDILVCPVTDPAWTPLLRVASGVVTETGGVLSHAAIVAREHRIPAILGVPDATTAIVDGATVTVDGTSGTVSTAGERHR